MGLAAPTLLAHGYDEQKHRLLPRAITGEDTWCQLFSEPTNGSDLAGLATHAEQDGDEWVVNGQKLWSTSAHHADLGLLLARTDPDVPKHRGISYFVLPMHQPGVEVRPVHQMNEHSSFNEVFLSDARVPATNLVGDARRRLAHRHDDAGVRAPVRRPSAPGRRRSRSGGPPRRPPPRPRSTSRRTPGTRSGPGGPTSSSRSPSCRGAPTTRSPARRWPPSSPCAGPTSGRRAGPRPPAPPGGRPGSEGSLGKLAASRVAQASARTHSLLAGADGQLRHADSLLDGVVTEVLLSVPAQSIAGGTDEIQHNIIGEKVLDLPREPSVDRDIPYREIKRS